MKLSDLETSAPPEPGAVIVEEIGLPPRSLSPHFYNLDEWMEAVMERVNALPPVDRERARVPTTAALEARRWATDVRWLRRMRPPHIALYVQVGEEYAVVLPEAPDGPWVYHLAADRSAT